MGTSSSSIGRKTEPRALAAVDRGGHQPAGCFGNEPAVTDCCRPVTGASGARDTRRRLGPALSRTSSRRPRRSSQQLGGGGLLYRESLRWPRRALQVATQWRQTFAADAAAARVRFVLLAVTAVVGFLGASSAARADVDATGAFEQSVQLGVPAFHGLQPDLALSYSSSTPDGWLGEGWSLHGLSVIRRVSALGGDPAWDGTDGYTLDGRDLIACPAAGSSSPWASSPSCAYPATGDVAYTTRVESYQRIAFEPISDSWEIRRTDGVRLTYLPEVSTSAGVLEWFLSSVRDLSGNVVSYTYGSASASGLGCIDGQTSVLQEISYGGYDRFSDDLATRSSLGGDGRRSVVQRVATADHRRIRPLRRTIRAYALGHTVDANRELFLDSVQEYGADAVISPSVGVVGGTSQPAITFTTPPDDPQWSALPRASLPGWWSAGGDALTTQDELTGETSWSRRFLRPGRAERRNAPGERRLQRRRPG